MIMAAQEEALARIANPETKVFWEAAARTRLSLAPRHRGRSGPGYKVPGGKRKLLSEKPGFPSQLPCLF